MFIAAYSRITSYFQASGSCLAGYIEIAGKCSIGPGNISFSGDVSIHIHILVKLGISFGFGITVKSSIPRGFKGAIHFSILKGGVSFYIKVSGHIGILKVRGAAYGQILANGYITISGDIALQIRSTVHRLISIGGGIGIKSSIPHNMKNVFQGSHAAYIQRTIYSAISLNRCIMAHGYISGKFRSPGHIEGTGKLAICPGHVAICYHVPMRNHVAVRNDVATGNDIGITGNISRRSNLPIGVKIGIDRCLSVHRQGAVNLLISFCFTVAIYRGIPFDFRRSFHRLIAFYSRRSISRSIAIEIGISGDGKRIRTCTACYI